MGLTFKENEKLERVQWKATHKHSKNNPRVCDCFAVGELESSGYLTRQEKEKKGMKRKKRSLAQNGKKIFTVLESQQKPQLEIKCLLGIMVWDFFLQCVVSL